MCKKCQMRVIAFIVLAYAAVLTGYFAYEWVYASGAVYGFQRAVQETQQ